MFHRARQQTAETLEGLRFDLCCYMSHNFCDCKYGYKPYKLGRPPWKEKSWGGEETGCPELRSVIHILNVMTDDEFDTFVKRANGIRL